MMIAELIVWAERQSLAFGLVNGRLTRLSEEHQGPARLLVMQRVAEGVFGGVDQARAWMAAPSSWFGGLSPSDLARESEDRSQFALKALVCWHRSTLRPVNA